MNPRKLGKLGNNKQEPWKVPLPEFIQEIYFKQFGKSAPDIVMSIEDRIRRTNEKKRASQAARRQGKSEDARS